MGECSRVLGGIPLKHPVDVGKVDSCRSQKKGRKTDKDRERDKKMQRRDTWINRDNARMEGKEKEGEREEGGGGGGT